MFFGNIVKYRSLFVGMWRDQVDEWEALQSIYGEHFSFVFVEHVPGLELDSTQGTQGIDFEALRMDGEPSSPDWKITCRICLAISTSCLNVGMVSEEGDVLKVGHVEHIPLWSFDLHVQPWDMRWQSLRAGCALKIERS